MITVAALDSNDSLTSFTNYGQEGVDVGVLGEFIPGPDIDGGIRYASGSSQSAAIVSASTALIGTYQEDFEQSIVKCAMINGINQVPALENMILTEGKIDINSSLSLYQNIQEEYTVSNTANEGNGSLRFALEEVCGISKIFFDSDLNGQIINIVDKPLIFNWPIEVRGNGQNQTLINGVNTNTINIGYNGDLELRDLYLSNSSNNALTLYNRGILQISNSVKIE